MKHRTSATVQQQFPYCYEFPRPALTVDCVVFGLALDRLKVLFVRRDTPPFINQWSLPGGFVQAEEDLDECAKRVLLRKTGCKNIYIEQLYTFGSTDRDPRERTISVTYYALVNSAEFPMAENTSAPEKQAGWFDIENTPKLAFDHNEILRLALARLRAKITYQPISFELLPKAFTLTKLQNVYEVILGEPLDKRNFRKKLLSYGILKPLQAWEQNGRQRPAQLYSFDRLAYKRLVNTGTPFEV
jgi:8-oxo-dGTP diphosphatase